MLSLKDRNLVVVGGSRGVGRRIVQAAAREGARVLAVARREEPLRQLAEEVPGTGVLALDAADENAPARVFARLRPDMLVLCAGAFPPAAPLQELDWQAFAANWEADVKIAFHFLKAALALPLAAGTSVLLVSSGAALAGSPNSGGYAGAKRTQMFMANYSQKESDRLGLGLRFTTLAPRILPDTDLGRSAVAGYARYLGISEADFIRSMDQPPSASDVADAAVAVFKDPERFKARVFVVSGKGLEAAP
jgi:NAD(P)-dependent dehydrogenase (short-subunit alcohol dehydrogenase family)